MATSKEPPAGLPDARTSGFRCRCPWHRGAHWYFGARWCGENMRESTDRYPPNWCAECCSSLHIHLGSKLLPTITASERKIVVRWLVGQNMGSVARKLLAMGLRSPGGQAEPA